MSELLRINAVRGAGNALQGFEEIDEIDVGVARVATAVDLAAGDLQGGKQTGGTVGQVVVSHAAWKPGRIGKSG